TTGIQALDLVGRKLLRDRGRTLAELHRCVDQTLTRARARPRLVPLADALAQVWLELDEVVALLLHDRAPSTAMATPLLWAFGHAVVGWLWLDMALLCGGQSPFERGKLAAAHAFFSYELPRIGPWLQAVRGGDSLLALTTNDCFHP
ncbi:MAG: acyl-CoA dehydrogenase C-terminal domain-containing protein, partial [Xanthomonadales bacterium]|nr:acyl-CoA dehydrogenase C-terminal domain-containing protein [Xanthomonadales bacterium]